MHYPAHVTDLSYRYDGSLQGLFCCIFESYARREVPAAVLTPEDGQTSLFGVRDVETDPARAARVARGLARLGPEVRDCVSVGFLCADAGKDLALLRFARRCFEGGPQTLRALGDPDVAAAFRAERAVRREACKASELLRFEERGGMLGARIHPVHHILPLMRGCFCSRLPDEDFLIYDASHGLALLRRAGRVQYLPMERYLPDAEEAELDWQALWKRFFRALTIEERRNEKLQMQHVPKRYWQDMCEMQRENTPRH